MAHRSRRRLKPWRLAGLEKSVVIIGNRALKAPRYRWGLDLFPGVLTIGVHPGNLGFMGVADVLQHRLHIN